MHDDRSCATDKPATLFSCCRAAIEFAETSPPVTHFADSHPVS